MTGRVAKKIAEKLTAAFAPKEMHILDESDQHAGHVGARAEGETHFRIKITSPQFAGKSRVETHRMIMAVLEEELADRVHALSISAKAE